MVMKVIEIGLNHVLPHIERPLALATGYFDGIHLGHQALILEARRLAQEKNYASAVLSFNPNPLVTLGKMKEEKYLTSLNDRAKILEDLGIDYFLILDFNQETANMLPEDFVQKFMIDMHVKEVVCGFDFFFGRFGKGDGKFLKQYSQYFNVSIIDQVAEANQKISSTYIIQLLQNGDVQKANHLLTRPYHVQGKVIAGKQRGRLLGFPTANIAYGAYYLPRFGVYGVRVKLHHQMYEGMCNIGLNPTFNDLKRPSIEVYIFDFKQEIYDETIDIYFYCFTRKEQPFASFQVLKEQLIQDEKEIRNYFRQEN